MTILGQKSNTYIPPHRSHFECCFFIFLFSKIEIHICISIISQNQNKKDSPIFVKNNRGVRNKYFYLFSKNPWFSAFESHCSPPREKQMFFPTPFPHRYLDALHHSICDSKKLVNLGYHFEFFSHVRLGNFPGSLEIFNKRIEGLPHIITDKC